MNSASAATSVQSARVHRNGSCQDTGAYELGTREWDEAYHQWNGMKRC